MTTPDAQQASDKARADSEAAHREAEAIEKDLPAAKKAKEDAADAAKKAEEKVGPLETTAQNSAGQAKASEAACREAQENERLTEREVHRTEVELATMREMNDDPSNREVKVLENDLVVGRAELAKQAAARKKTCDKAEADRKKADEDQKAAKAAQADADAQRLRADTAGNDFKALETKAHDLRVKAINLAGLAEMLKNVTTAKAGDAATIGPSVTPPHPNTNAASGGGGADPQPPNEQGFHRSSALNFTTGANLNLFLIGGQDYAEVSGKMIELTEGYAITHVLAADVSIVLGLKLDETFGLEFKLDGNDDTRYISGHRIEANVGIRLEHVKGEYHETVHGDRIENNPSFYFGKNKVRQQERDERLMRTAQKVLAKHKAKFEDFRKQVALDYKTQADKLKTVETTIEKYQADLKLYDEKIKELEAKWDTLKQQVDDFKSNSDGFIKFLVQGSANISADTMKVRVDDKLQVVCDAIAELKGSEIKWA